MNKSIIGVMAFLTGFYGLSFWFDGKPQEFPVASVIMIIFGAGVFVASIITKKASPAEKKPRISTIWKLRLAKWFLMLFLFSDAIFLSRYMELRHSSHLVGFLLQLPLIPAFIAYLWAHRKADEQKQFFLWTHKKE